MSKSLEIKYQGIKITIIMSASSLDPCETSFLFQRLTVLIQRYNSVLILESFCSDEDPDL